MRKNWLYRSSCIIDCGDSQSLRLTGWSESGAPRFADTLIRLWVIHRGPLHRRCFLIRDIEGVGSPVCSGARNPETLIPYWPQKQNGESRVFEQILTRLFNGI